jgi:hypothetical protein
MGKTYYVSHNMRHGFWIVCCNDHGHYRDIARYGNHQAAVNAADALNNQQYASEHGKAQFAIGAL